MRDPSAEGNQKSNRDLESRYDYEGTSVTPYQVRGGWLTAFLLFATFTNLLNLFTACGQLADVQSSSDKYQDPGTAQMLWFCALIVQAAIVVSIFGVWYWKIWGYYGLMAGYVLGMIVNLFTGNTLYLISGAISLPVVYALVNPKMDMLE